ncbi:MAG: DUF2142 domain-containing protein, partial [Mycobacteriales bacterium]
LWGARAVSDWLVILLLGVAGYLLRRYHPRRAMLVGLAVAVTPQVLFLGSVVGDSGLEISAALATWAGLMCIADRADPPPAPLVWLTAAAAAVLATARPLSPLFLAVIVLVASRSGRPGLATRLTGERTVQQGLRVVTAAVVLAVGWLALRGAPHLLSPAGSGPDPLSHRLELSWHLLGAHLQQLVGVLGWTDTPLSPLTEVCWLAALVALLVAARPRRRAALVAPAVVAGLVIGLPFLQTAVSGIPTQGRDVLPLAVGIPLLLARTIPRRRIPAVAVPALVAIGQLATFARGLRRYSVGLAGPILPLHPSWQPPLGLIPLELLFLAAVTVAAVGVHRAVRVTRPERRPPGWPVARPRPSAH